MRFFDVILILLTTFSAGCSGLKGNAVAHYNDHLVVLERKKGGEVIALMLGGVNSSFWDLDEMKVVHEEVSYNVSELVGSELVLNSGDVTGQPCRLGPVKHGVWKRGTREYNISGGLSVWIRSEHVVAVRVYRKNAGMKIMVGDKNLGKVALEEIARVMDDELKEEVYFSQY